MGDYLPLFMFVVGASGGLGGMFLAASRLLAAWDREKDLREQNARLSERNNWLKENQQTREAFVSQRHELDKKILRLEQQIYTQENLEAKITSIVADITRPKIGQYPEKF
jgi:septal ring factor EnvC (AmiA/AmiB activator)